MHLNMSYIVSIAYNVSCGIAPEGQESLSTERLGFLFFTACCLMHAQLYNSINIELFINCNTIDTKINFAPCITDYLRK